MESFILCNEISNRFKKNIYILDSGLKLVFIYISDLKLFSKCGERSGLRRAEEGSHSRQEY